MMALLQNQRFIVLSNTVLVIRSFVLLMVIDWSGIMGLLFFLLKAIKNMSEFRGYHINQRETKSKDKKLNRCFKNVRQRL